MEIRIEPSEDRFLSAGDGLMMQIAVLHSTYECAKMHRTYLQDVREPVARACLGWVNTFGEEEVLALFAVSRLSRLFVRSGYKRGGEPVFVFKRHSTLAAPVQNAGLHWTTAKHPYNAQREV